MERSGTPVTPNQEHVPAKHMTNGEALVKKVWVGIGKAVESQRPKAWKERIIRVIYENIIPKLSPENQRWMAEIRPKVETAAKIGGVAITAGEIALVVAAGVKVKNKVSAALEQRAVDKGIRKILRGPSAIPDMPVAWAGPIAPEDPQFTRWIVDITKQYRDKYGNDPVQSGRFAATLRRMVEDASDMSAGGTKKLWSEVLDKAVDNHPWRARSKLQKVFKKTYKDVLWHDGVAGVGAGQAIVDGLAKDAFAKWENIQFPGLADLLHIGQPYPSERAADVERVASMFLRNARDFESITPPTFDQILAAARIPDPRILYEMAQDPQWNRIVTLLPNYPVVQAYANTLQAQDRAFDALVEKPIKDIAAKKIKLRRLRERYRKRRIEQPHEHPYGKRFAEIIGMSEPTGVRDIPERPPFIDAHLKQRAAAKASEESAASIGNNPRTWWVDRKRAGLDTSVREQEFRNIRERAEKMQNAELAARAADRAASRARMGPGGRPWVREAPRQAARRLEKADALSTLRERVSTLPERDAIRRKAQAKKDQQEAWDFQAMKMRAKQEMEADLDQRKRLADSLERAAMVREHRAAQEKEAKTMFVGLTGKVEDNLKHYRRALIRGSTIDPMLAERQPDLVAEIAGRVAGLGTNETINAKDLASLLVHIAEDPNNTAYAPLVQKLRDAGDDLRSTRVLKDAATLLEHAYNNQKGVKKMQGGYGMVDTKFTTLAAFWAQRLGLAGLGELIAK